jgi:hypothetical protein
MPINRVQSQPGLSLATFFGSYDITGADVRDAFEAALAASTNLGLSDQKTVAEVRAMLAGPGAGQQSLARILERELAG